MEWLKDELESLQAQRDELEEELERALEDNATLKAMILRIKATLQVE